MASDDDSTIWVDVAARLDEREAENAVDKLKDHFKRTKVPVEPDLDEAATDRTTGRLRDKLRGAGKTLSDSISDAFDHADAAADKASKRMGNRFKGLGNEIGKTMGEELSHALGTSEGGVGSSLEKLFKDKFGGLADVLSGHGSGDLLGSFEILRGTIHDAATGLRDIAPEGSRAAKGLGAVADAAGPLAAAFAAVLGVEQLAKNPAVQDNPLGRGFFGDWRSGDPNSIVGPNSPLDVIGGWFGFDPSGKRHRAAQQPPGPPATIGGSGGLPGGVTVAPGGGLGGAGAGPVGTRSSISGVTQHVTLVDAIHGEGGSPTVPLIQRPDGTWTSPDPSWAHLIQRESGGNPSIQNNWDSNAAAGDPSRGLFQFTRSTWARSGGLKYGADPGSATPQQQAEIAANLIRSNPSGSDWGAGLPGRENAGGLLAGLGAPRSAGWFGSGYTASPAGLGTPGFGGGGGAQPSQQGGQSGGPITQKPIGTGKGAGVSGGGIIGAAEQAGVAAAGVAGFGAGGIAAQMAEQEINLAVQKGSQLAYAAASAPLETLWLGGGQMGAPSLQSPLFGWPGKILGSLIGQQTNLPNLAGATQPPKQPDQKGEQEDPAGGKQGGPTGHKDDPMHVSVTNPPQGPGQGDATTQSNWAAMTGVTGAMV